MTAPASTHAIRVHCQRCGIVATLDSIGRAMTEATIHRNACPHGAGATVATYRALTAAEWRAIHRDARHVSRFDGRTMMLMIDRDTGGTVLYPVRVED